MWMPRLAGDVTPMRNHDLLRQGQPETRAPFLGGVEQVEHVLAFLLLDARTLVVDLDPDTTVVTTRLELGSSAIGHGLSRVAQ